MRSAYVTVLMAALAAASGAEEDKDVRISLADGSVLVGRVVAEDEEALTIRTAAGLEIRVPRAILASAHHETETETGDPTDSRLMFAPTGRPLRRGDAYFSDHSVFLPGIAYGLTDNLNVGAGVSFIPAVDIEDQLFYVSPRLGFRASGKAAFSVGALYATGADEAAAILFGVGTLGGPKASLTAGLGLGAHRNTIERYDQYGRYLATEGDWKWRDAPILMLGGSAQLSKRLALVSENWIFLGKDVDLSDQPFGIALRFFNHRMSADVGLVLVADVVREGLPIPWLSFTYHFGRQGGSDRR